ncbi:engulfment and cell motility protein 1 [Pseudohyphozyma bogoriensis]|nr:engulfment and cell motility protein 1 [Pseudohyphozyma bogoriensis]
MSTTPSPPQASTSKLPSATTDAPAPSKPAHASTSAAKAPAKASPTVFVSYGDRQVKARIDREVPLSEILRQLVASTQLGVSEPAALFALRTVGGELITEDNLGAFLDVGGQPLVLTSSPTLEAVEMVEKLNSGEPSVIKLATFSLKTLIKEQGFLNEFLARGGLDALQEVIRKSSGNTLAYALLSIQNLISEDRGWEGLDDDFAARIVEIIVTEPLINISRPATAILRQLSQSSLPSSATNGDASPHPTAPSGFTKIFHEISLQPEFMKLLVTKLSSGDVPVATNSLALINSLLRGSISLGDRTFGDELEALGGWALVGVRCLSSLSSEIRNVIPTALSLPPSQNLVEAQSAGGELAPFLAFQSNLVAFLHLSLSTPINEGVYALFDDIWNGSALEDDGDESFRWRKVGFATESPQYEFEKTGVLGLKAFAKFAIDHSGEFAAAVKDQLSRPEDRRCPIATASSAVITILSDFFDITQGLSQSPTSPQPFLLRFYEVHALATLFFVRIWLESSATSGDFERVVMLVKSQVNAALNPGFSEKTWNEVKQDFQHAEYKHVRDRQMREMEIEDDILGKAPVRNLRGRLYRESYEFVRNQRISCLHEGAWFKSGAKKAKDAKPWRFYRLAANRKMLHYVETAERIPIRGGLDDLPERIDLSLVTDVIAGRGGSTSVGVQQQQRGTSIMSGSSVASPPFSSFRQATSPTLGSTNPLAFTLGSSDGILAELIAPDESTYAEWVDGLSLLRPDGSISTKETAEFVQILTEIGVKIKLLDLSGEKVDIPASLPVGMPPRSNPRNTPPKGLTTVDSDATLFDRGQQRASAEISARRPAHAHVSGGTGLGGPLFQVRSSELPTAEGIIATRPRVGEDVEKGGRGGGGALEKSKSVGGGDHAGTGEDGAGEEEEWTYPEGGWRAWKVVLGCYFIIACQNGYGLQWGVYSSDLHTNVFPDTPLSILNLVIGLNNWCMGAGGLIGGRLGDLFGYKRMIAIGSVCTFISLIISAFVHRSLPLLFVFQGFCLGTSMSIAMPLTVSLPAQWFLKRRGMATGIAISAAGVGGGFSSLIVRGLLPRQGYRNTLIIYACMNAALTAFGWTLLEVRMPPRSKEELKKWLPKGIWGDVATYSFAVALTLGVIGFLNPPYFITSYTTRQVPTLDPKSIAPAVPLIVGNFFSGSGRIFAGFVADYIGPVNALILTFAMGGTIQMVFWPFAKTYGSIIAFSCIYSFCGAWWLSLLPAALAQVFGVKGLATTCGLMILVSAPGGLVGPSLGGVILSATGSYLGVALFSGGVMVAAALILLPARLSRERRVFAKF